MKPKMRFVLAKKRNLPSKLRVITIDQPVVPSKRLIWNRSYKVLEMSDSQTSCVEIEILMSNFLRMMFVLTYTWFNRLSCTQKNTDKTHVLTS